MSVLDNCKKWKRLNLAPGRGPTPFSHLLPSPPSTAPSPCRHRRGRGLCCPLPPPLAPLEDKGDSSRPLDTRTCSLFSPSLRSARSKNPRRTVAAAVGFAWPPCSPLVAFVSTGFAVVDYVSTPAGLDRDPLHRAQSRCFAVRLRRTSPSNSSPSSAPKPPAGHREPPGESPFRGQPSPPSSAHRS